MSDWPLYAAMVRTGLHFCETLDQFRALMAEQADNARACRDEAPGVANEIRAMSLKRKSELENGL